MLLYVQVSRSAAVLHLSEHHGDGSPHGVAWFPVRDVSALHKERSPVRTRPMRAGNDPDAPGGPPMQVTEPNGNIRHRRSRRPPVRRTDTLCTYRLSLSGRSA
uniref:Glyoxalase superfamily protein n=1 Tax=Streptomyces sp. NBC_00119 TaxID=2975659 RepID=A0AAU1UPB2_9ACTN